MKIQAVTKGGRHLIVSPLEKELRMGDVFTISGVLALNRISGKPIIPEQERAFVVLEPEKIGSQIVSIYPALIWGKTVQGTAVGKETVDVLRA